MVKRERSPRELAGYHPVGSVPLVVSHAMDSPFQPHVRGPSRPHSPPQQQRPSSPPHRTNLGSLVQLRDLLKVGKPKVAKGRLAVRDAILQLFPSQVKSFIRDNDWPPEHAIRAHLWRHLCEHHGTEAAAAAKGFYQETVDQMFGRNQLFLAIVGSHTLGQCFEEIEERPEECTSLPSFVDPSSLLTYSLSEKGCLATRRVICVLGYTHPDITYCPGLYSLSSVFLHYMSEEDAYNCLYVLVRSRQGKFLHQTKLGYEAAWRTVFALTKKHAKAAFVHIGKFVKSADQLEHIFEDWYWWIFQHLPFSHMVRVIDCFLFEGKKVLYRVAMAIIILFAKHSAKEDSRYSQEARHSGLQAAIIRFCHEIPATPGRLMKVAFGIRGLSQKNINAILLRIEMGLKSKSIVCAPTPILRSFSSEGILPTSQSQINIHTTSHTLTIRERRLSPGARSWSMGVLPLVSNFKNSTLTSDQLLTLWSWLPARITMYQPELIYTTEEHGCSLMTFYSRVQNYEPNLIIIKTTTNEIFGAYCSTKWAERNTKSDTGKKQTYFGTGETFIFTIYPEMRKYPWVGLSHVGAESGPLKHSAELFMAGDNHMITIGGGDGQAIWIDENIRFGGTGPCDTFQNPPLSCLQDFECKVLEVIGFT